MEKFRKSVFSFLAWFIAALILSAPNPTPVLAQAYSSQLTFLENFAVKLYEHGDLEQAQKEFQRILKIDPQSATAKKYLDDIGKKSGAAPADQRTSLDKTSAIAADIQSLRKDIVGYERDLSTTASLVRNLITENDQLYMALHKRSREVMELREKAYGIRYSEQYRDMMADLPPDRIPQNLHRADEILPSLYDVPVKTPHLDNIAGQVNATASEISALETDIATEEQAIRDLLAKGVNEQNVKEFQRLLSEKRDALVEKNLALIEKRERLDSLKNDLSSMNVDLKTANNRYLELINKIDKYYQSIKAEISTRNYVDQKMFSDLIVDYARKTQELETLKTRPVDAAPIVATAPTVPSTPTPGTAIPDGADIKIAAAAEAEAKRFQELMTGYEAKVKELDQLKASIAQRDAALTDYKTPLASQDNKLKQIDQDLADKEQQLSDLKSQLAYANNAMGTVKTQVKTIQSLLNESDRDLAGLSNGVAKIKELIRDQQGLSQSQTNSVETLTATAAENIARVKELEQKIAELEAQAKEQAAAPSPDELLQAELQKTEQALAKSQKQAAAFSATMTDKEQAFDALQDKLTIAEKRIASLELRINGKEENILTLEERIAGKDNEIRQLQDAAEASLRKPLTITPVNDPGEITRLKEKIKELQTAMVGVDNLKDQNQAHEQELTALTQRLGQTIADKKKLEARVFDLSLQLEDQKNQFARASSTTDNNIRQTRASLQAKELDIREREVALDKANAELTRRASALNEAESQIKMLEIKLAAFENKQQAIRSVVDKRDAELTKITAELNAAKNSVQNTNKENAMAQVRIKELEKTASIAARNLEECQLQNTNTDKQAELLRKDLKIAQDLIRSRDKDIATIDRIKDELTKRDKIIADLKEQLNQKSTAVIERSKAFGAEPENNIDTVADIILNEKAAESGAHK